MYRIYKGALLKIISNLKVTLAILRKKSKIKGLSASKELSTSSHLTFKIFILSNYSLPSRGSVITQGMATGLSFHMCAGSCFSEDIGT